MLEMALSHEGACLATASGLTGKRKRAPKHASSRGKGRGASAQKCRPSLTWLLPGAARAQLRPLPRPTKPPPPGITPLRRLGVWRRVREEGDSRTIVFVTLEGEVVRRPHSFYAAQRDEAILAAKGIRGRGRESCILDPEGLAPFAAHCATSSEVELQYWCLPPPLVRAYASLGIETLYPWQAQCLHLALPRRKNHPNASVSGEERWKSLIYCAPTSGGKSLVAEVLIARRLLFEGVRCLFVVPHVSLCSEKVQHLRQLLGPLTLRVEAFHSGANAASNWYAGVDVAVCTLEKANLIINRLVRDLLVPGVAMADDWSENSSAFGQPTVGDCDPATAGVDGSSCWARHLWKSLRLRTPAVGGEFPVGLVCVDEVHFLGNAQRGHVLEMLLAKLFFLNQFLQRPVQVVGMSATLSNAQQLASWLEAELFVTDSRPSPLDVFVKVGPEVFSWSEDKGLQLTRRLHGGRLFLSSVGEAATCAAARALAAAACVSGAGSGIAGTQQTSSCVLPSEQHVSLSASALRLLREEVCAVSTGLTSGGQGPVLGEAKEVVGGGHHAGWMADAEHLGALTWEMLREGRRVIIFCPTQEWTARTASFLAKALPFYRRAEAWADLVKERACICLEKLRLSQQPGEPPPGDSRWQASNLHQRQLEHQREQERALQQAQQELLALPVSMLAQLLVKSPHLYVDPHILRGREELQWQLKQLALLSPSTMLAAVREGVAYHNAGLSAAERGCVEAGYRKGHLSVLCATSTLALGVNLPAARVIIRAPHVGRNALLSPSDFHQMAGRAGRTGLERRGDAYMICSPSTLPHVRMLLTKVATSETSGSSSGPIQKDSSAVLSSLRGQKLCRFFLEAVHVLLPLVRHTTGTAAQETCSAFLDVAAILLRCTLRGRQESHLRLIKEAAECARYLHAYYLLETEPSASMGVPLADTCGCGCCVRDQEKSLEADSKVEGTRQDPTIGHDEAVGDPRRPAGLEKPSLLSLAFPSSPLPDSCKLLLQQYPCLRSPVVLTRMLQGGEFRKVAERLAQETSLPGSPVAHQTTKERPELTSPAAHESNSWVPLRFGSASGHRGHIAAACADEHEAFLSAFRLHFQGLDALAARLTGDTSCLVDVNSAASHVARSDWRDVGGRLAVTEIGGAAVEAGVAPWEAAELFADIFKTSIFGLCAATEIHLIFLAAVAVGGDTQPHWRSYLSVYDGLDATCRRVADFLGIQRQVICREAVKEQGGSRHVISDTAELLLADRLSFSQLRSRVEMETHRRFFFALLLHGVYKEGQAYGTVMRRFGVTKNGLVACISQGALVAATLASFLRTLRPQEAALSEVCFLLASKLKLACPPVGEVPRILTDLSAGGQQPGRFADHDSTVALQQFLQLEGMTPGRAAALHAFQIYSCAELNRTPIHDVFKALEAAEPAPLVQPKLGTQQYQAWMYKIRRQRARLLAITLKLKDAAHREHAIQLQVSLTVISLVHWDCGRRGISVSADTNGLFQALEDEAAGHWSLVGKVTQNLSDEEHANSNDLQLRYSQPS